MDANYTQERMNELQRNQEFAGALGKILSGKSNYKPVIEMRKVEIKCPSCGSILADNMKFCPECGTKIEKPTN
ncbi:zinc-ribbon domain protein [uncultured archaeon]|nr:zinc-ribbon domain protein [uncultured archaeon]